MNVKKICLSLALLLPMVCAPAALACGDDDGYQSNYGNNGRRGGWQNQSGYNGQDRSRWQRKMARKMAWKQRQLASNDPYYRYWSQNPSQYQSLWRSQQELNNLLGQGVISPQEKMLLEQQIAAYQGQINNNPYLNGSGYADPYAPQYPYGYSNYQGTVTGNLVNGLTGNGLNGNGNPFISASVPGLLQKLASYWNGQGLGY